MAPDPQPTPRQAKRKHPRRNWFLLVGVVVAVAIVIIAASGAGNKSGASSSTPRTAGSSGSSSRMGDNGVLATSNPVLLGIQAHLSSLGLKCKQSESEIAADIYFAYGDLRKHGVGESMSSVAANIDNAVPATGGPFDCTALTADWLARVES
jgi:hypothetical protein